MNFSKYRQAAMIATIIEVCIAIMIIVGVTYSTTWHWYNVALGVAIGDIWFTLTFNKNLWQATHDV